MVRLLNGGVWRPFFSHASATMRKTRATNPSLPPSSDLTFQRRFDSRHFEKFKISRCFSSTGSFLCGKKSEFSTEGEKILYGILTQKFPLATDVDVKDVSGGCGSMYEVYVTSSEFKGKRTVIQHRMINEALAEEIKDMHGLRIFTSLPS